MTVTFVPQGIDGLQELPQLIDVVVPSVTVNVPPPAVDTVSVYVLSVKPTVTFCVWFMGTVHVGPLGAQPPPDQVGVPEPGVVVVAVRRIGDPYG